MVRNRPETTLFLMQSLDGKISTGDVDERDQEIDFPKIKGIKEGNYQYYEFLFKTDRHAIISGKVLAKIGVNSREKADDHKDVTLIVIDRKPHLTKQGINYLVNSFKSIFVVEFCKQFQRSANTCLKYFSSNLLLSLFCFISESIHIFIEPSSVWFLNFSLPILQCKASSF